MDYNLIPSSVNIHCHFTHNLWQNCTEFVPLAGIPPIDQESHDTYSCKGLGSVQDPNFTMIDGVIDNFHLNEETLVGKHTTHAWAAVIYIRDVL